MQQGYYCKFERYGPPVMYFTPIEKEKAGREESAQVASQKGVKACPSVTAHVKGPGTFRLLMTIEPLYYHILNILPMFLFGCLFLSLF